MEELELRLRETLWSAGDLIAPVDPVAAVHAGMRRRVRRRALIGATAATFATLGFVVGVVASRDSGGTQLPAVPSSSLRSPSVVSTAPESPSSVAVPAGSTAVSASLLPPALIAPPAVSRSAAQSAPAVAGFVAADLTFIGAQRGWALGAAPCGDNSCTAVLETVDGGLSWRRPSEQRPASDPAAMITPGGAMCADPCVRGIRFSSDRVGYAFGGSLFGTEDAGASWHRHPDAAIVFALEPTKSDVIRVVSDTRGCPPGCAFLVQRSTDRGATWTSVRAPALGGLDARLLRRGDDLVVFADQHRAGGAGDAHTQIVVSRDRGATWVRRADPCSPPSGNDPNESDAVDAAIGTDGTFVVLCTPRAAQADGDSLRIAPDVGAPFGAARPVSGSASRVSVATAAAIVVSESSGSGVRLLRTVDGGRSFTRVLTTERQAQDADRFLAFTTDQVGTWLDGSGTTIWRTADAGATWTRRSFAAVG